MRLLRITTNSPLYLHDFYKNHTDLKVKSYKDQYQELMDDCYGWANFWTQALAKQGYEVWEPVVNAEYMQKKWASENGVSYNNTTWETDIIISQARIFKPDVLFVNSSPIYRPDFFNIIRNKCNSIRLIIGWCGSPISDLKYYKVFDLVLSNIPSLVNLFQTNGQQSEYFRHAFQPKILNKINKSKGKFDFTFIGSIYKGKGYHNNRERFLKELVSKTNLHMWSNITQSTKKEFKFAKIRRRLIEFIKILPLSKYFFYMPLMKKLMMTNYIDNTIATLSHPAVFGLSMFQKLSESCITLNTHIDISRKYASNMRLFEGTGVGTCVLTEFQENLHEIFKPDEEIITYRNVDEAIEKVDYLLKNKSEIYKIGNAGQVRTLRDHTFDLRAEQLSLIINRYINK